MNQQAAAGPDRGSRVLLTLCAVAVGFAAIDTYVVVLALPDMMAAVQVQVTELQRAAPIVSGFLLGYVAMLPLIGRIADLRGQVPVLLMSLGAFAFGSLVTAVSYDLTTMVVGRFLQGVGGGGLVPATMALVAALYPVERRGLPLGLVSAVQEFGAVMGPLFGALVLTFATWRGIFAINLAVGLVLAVAVHAMRVRDRSRGLDTPDARPPHPATRPPTALPDDAGRSSSADHPGRSSSAGHTGRSSSAAGEGRASGVSRRPQRRRLPDLLSIAALLAALGAGLMLFLEPIDLRRSLTWGELFRPYVETDSRWITPIGAITMGAALVLLLRSLLAKRPLIDLRGWLRAMIEADLRGALLLAVALGGVVLAFATADPEVAVVHEQAGWFLSVSAAAAVVFGLHVWRTPDPIIQPRALGAVPAWGSLVVSFLIGWALIAALVDIPLFARTTTERESQLGAALVLLRFLAALPIGAVVGGWLLRRLPAGPIAAVGMAAGAAGFWWMAQWDETALESAIANVPLVVAGLGFGLALAPVNAAMLATTRHDVHGLASALVVVTRMVGMLVGISVLTAWGLNRFYEAQRADPSLGPIELAIVQEQTVFQGAAVTAALAGVAALVFFRGAPTRGVRTAEALRV